MPDHSKRAATFAARLGFASRGLVYLLVGWFALDAARQGSAPKDNQQAMGSLADQPLGHALLGLVAVGLAGYALWRASEAIIDPDRRGTHAKALIERIGFGWSALVHLGLAFYAARLALDQASGNPSSDASARSWSGWLLDQPAGQWLVAAVGLVLIAGAGAQAWKAWQNRFAEDLSGDVPLPRYACMAGQIGYAARALVFLVIGWFFLTAAWHARASDAGGTGQALRTLREQPYGPWLLSLVAAGLILFGIFSLVEARFRRIRVG